MTLIVGAKASQSAFLIADSAVTIQAPTPHLMGGNPFGPAPHFSDAGRSVYQGACKLLELSPIAAAAWSGEATPAVNFLRSLQARCKLERDRPLPNAIQEVARVQAPLHKGFVILVATYSAGRAHLFCFRSSTPDIIDEERPIFVEGSGRKHFNPVAEEIRHLHLIPSPLDDTVLPCTIGRLQHIGQLQNLLKKGFGGTFCGLYVNGDGITWQADTMYIFRKTSDFAAPFDNTDLMVRVGWRGGWVMIKPVGPRDMGLLRPLTTAESDVRAWFDRWETEALSSPLDDLNRLRYVVMAGAEKKLVVIDRKDDPEKWIRFTINGTRLEGLSFRRPAINFLKKLQTQGVLFLSRDVAQQLTKNAATRR